MPWTDLVQILIYFALVAVTAPVLGSYMARLFAGERTFLSPVLVPIERAIYAVAGIEPNKEQGWLTYAGAVLTFNLAGCLLLFVIVRTQHLHPWNPAGMPPMSTFLAFNTAVSFATNTNWQAYGGESTLSYFSQMAGLTTQNFLSAGTGIAVGVAVIRGFVRKEISALGNFWVDLTRSVLYLLLPLSIIIASLLVWQGVPQNLDAYVHAKSLEGGAQTIAQGPAASQIAIKQLGTNGGGFFNANSSHPYENPTPLSNLIEMWAILAIPAAFCIMFGAMARDRRQGWAIFSAMAVIFVAGFAAMYAAEYAANPLLAHLPIDQSAGNMEGKEVRFGVVGSTLWAAATTAASNGSVNAMHDSFTPLGGMVALLNIMLGEIVFGGVGAGFYGMLLFVVLAVFMAGLMVGRTPEYLGKKIEAREVSLAIIALLSMPVGILVGGGLAAVIPQALASVQDKGPHGLTEILYAYASATGNNGSAFAGFGADTPWQNTALGLCMLLGRYAFIVPMLAIAGGLGAKRSAPPSAGTFPTHTPLFVGLLVAVILIVGGLTFFPALALGPIAEHFALLAGQTFP